MCDIYHTWTEDRDGHELLWNLINYNADYI